MTVWERHAARLRRQQEIARRQAQLEHFDRWCLDHPYKSWIVAMGVAIMVGELALLLRYAIEGGAGFIAK